MSDWTTSVGTAWTTRQRMPLGWATSQLPAENREVLPRFRLLLHRFLGVHNVYARVSRKLCTCRTLVITTSDLPGAVLEACEVAHEDFTNCAGIREQAFAVQKSLRETDDSSVLLGPHALDGARQRMNSWVDSRKVLVTHC